MATCSIPGCTAPVRARGFCQRHYDKRRRHGDPLYVPSMEVPPDERFWTYVEKTSQCWLWAGGKDWDGYGIFSADGRSVRAHRFAYEMLVGPIPDGLQLDHLCRVRACVRPDHLEPVTNRVNILRGEAPPALNNRKMLCKRGHLLPPDRKCRVCQVLHTRRHKGWDENRVIAQPIATPNHLKTACHQGHPFDEQNTYVDRAGHRHCRACHRDRVKADYLKRKERAKP